MSKKKRRPPEDSGGRSGKGSGKGSANNRTPDELTPPPVVSIEALLALEQLVRHHLPRHDAGEEAPSPRAQAQALVEQAYQTDDGETRFDLARQALEIDEYPDDASAEWDFGRALLAYRRHGETEDSQALLREAHAANPFVADYLLGNVMLPEQLPQIFAPGEESEAIRYAAEFLAGWRSTPGAAAWLRKTLQIAPRGGRRSPRRPSWSFLKGSVNDLPQAAGEIWQVDVRQTRLGCSHPDAAAVWALAITNADEEQIVALVPLGTDDRPTPREVLAAVLDAMRTPADGEPRRPETIQVLRKRYRESWVPKLAEISVRCGQITECEFIDDLLARLKQASAAVQLSVAERQRLAEGVADLPQEVGEIWQVASRKLSTWVTDQGEPQRPWVTLVLGSETMSILGQSMGLEPPSGETLWETILTAMVSPATGSPHLPEGIEVYSDILRDALQPYLEPLGVACAVSDQVEQLEAVLDDLSAHLDSGQPLAAMIDTPGVTLRHVGGLYQAAAEFYRQRPWHNVASDAVIEVRCDKFQANHWYLVVIGQSGVTFGLAMYEDWDVLQAVLRDEPGAERRNSGLSVVYSEAFEIAVRDLDAAEREGWPVASPEAYPLVLRVNPGLAVRPPLAWELELLEACLRAVGPFLTQDASTSARMTVPVASGELTLELLRAE